MSEPHRLGEISLPLRASRCGGGIPNRLALRASGYLLDLLGVFASRVEEFFDRVRSKRGRNAKE